MGANVIFTPRSSRDDFYIGPIFATFGSEVSSMNHHYLDEGVGQLNMRIPLPQNDLSADISLQPAQVEELLRFVRSLDAYCEPDQLLRSLPPMLSELVVSNTTALAVVNSGILSGYVVGHEGTIATESALELFRPEIQQIMSQEPHPVVISPVDSETEFRGICQFFREYGNESLCMLPLNTAHRHLGVLCFARKSQNSFARSEVDLLALVADYVALAIDDCLNFCHSEAVRFELENERKKLKLVLDLNNSVVSNLEPREVLRAVSPSIRKTMGLDGVALILPDATNRQLQLHALDFPNGNSIPQQDISISLDGSVAGKALRSGKPWIGDIEELSRSGFNNSWGDSANSVGTICMLPLIRCNSSLGVLCLMSLEKNAFTVADVEFLSQIAGQVAIAIDNAFAYRRITELSDQLNQEKLYLEDEIRSELNFEEIIGNSAALSRVLRQVEAVAPTGSTVLIQGETGSGKELIARAVHNLSQRRKHSFVKLNCAAIPTGLLESELFGHEKGAFTGAIAQRIGRFELASQGTIFLDEISEIPVDLQPKLLRVLQEREYERLGSSRTLRTDARLIAATNRNLSAMVEEQKFRSDLFYRLNVFPIYVPPLRERKEDIPFLVRHFAQHFARNMTKEIDTISAETMNALSNYSWPGNIRELQNVIERAVILTKGPVLKVSLADLKSKSHDTNGYANGATTLEEVERKHILSILEQTNWVFAGPNGAAAKLGMKRPTLQFRMQKLGIFRPKS
jgi:formate hydrogenlyase transcriptional activator